MHFAFEEEQEEFRGILRGMLGDRVTSASRRESLDQGMDTQLWRLLTQEMGVPGLHVAEDDGGSGFSLLETAVVVAETGRALAVVPVVSTILALEAVLRCGSDAQRERWAPSLASGEIIGALGVRDTSDLVGAGVVATGSGTVVLDGTLSVLDAGVADLLIVPARDDAGIVRLHAVAANAPGVTVTPVASLDLTRPLAEVSFAGAPAEALPVDGVTDVITLARILLAFESIGVAERALDLAVDYAGTRHQFNRAIGSFQAVKHKCAEVAVEVDLAVGAAMYAAMLAVDGDPRTAAAAALANAQASEALRRSASELLQILGGIGFTWEHDGHLFYRRAKANEVLFGTPSDLRDVAALAAAS